MATHVWLQRAPQPGGGLRPASRAVGAQVSPMDVQLPLPFCGFLDPFLVISGPISDMLFGREAEIGKFSKFMANLAKIV